MKATTRKIRRKSNLHPITQVENALAIAISQGDREAQARLTKELEALMQPAAPFLA